MDYGILKSKKQKMKTNNQDTAQLRDTINRINAISTGTKEKFTIIHALRSGEKPYTDIQKIFQARNKSTIYKYLNDLFQVDIIKKRVERIPGKRPLSYYSLSSLTLDLSPAMISKILGYKDEYGQVGEYNEVIFGKMPKLKVIGKDGKETNFYPSILLGDLLDANLRVENAISVLNSTSKSLYDGISTTEIGDIVIENLKHIDNNLAAMFKKFIDLDLTVLVNSKTEVWDRDKISEMIKERRRVRELSTSELKFLSHKIIRNIKKLTQTPSEEFVVAYIDMLANTM
jgi:DNA-binding HxlR family transcriptional regulator/transcriptional regulator NrdR family protein